MYIVGTLITVPCHTLLAAPVTGTLVIMVRNTLLPATWSGYVLDNRCMSLAWLHVRGNNASTDYDFLRHKILHHAALRNDFPSIVYFRLYMPFNYLMLNYRAC